MLEPHWKPLPKAPKTIPDKDAYVGIPVQSLYLGFLSEFPRKKCILDLGCGSAYLTRLMLSHENQVLGLDNSAPIIRDLQCQENLPVEVYQVGSFSRSDSKNFEFLFCLDVLEHVPKALRHEFLRECFSLKTTKNQFLFSIPRDGHGARDLVEWIEIKPFLKGFDWKLYALDHPLWFQLFQALKARIKSIFFSPIHSNSYERNLGYRNWHRTLTSKWINALGQILLKGFEVFPMRLEEKSGMDDGRIHLLWVGPKTNES